MRQRLKENQALRVKSDGNQNSNSQSGSLGAAVAAFISSSLFIPWSYLVTLVTPSHTTRFVRI